MDKDNKQATIVNSMVKDYMKYYTKYKQMYGENTILLYQNGSFFEIFDPIPESTYADTVCNLLNIICSRKNKSILEISYQNPRFGGFTIHSLEKYLRVLQANDWTTVLVEQTTPPPRPKREVTQIISPGTYIDSNADVQSNFVFSVYVEKLKQFQTNTYLNYVGLSAIDVSTGKIYVYETADTLTDKTLGAQEAYRFIHSYSSNPKEVIINFASEHDQEFVDTLAIRKHYANQWFNSFMTKISYQNKIFGKYYKSDLLTPVEVIGLEQYEHARLSLCVLFQYIYEHNPRLLSRIDVPEYWDLSKHLLLSHDAYEQLNLYSSNNYSVYHVLNQTSTPMGARLLKDRLLHPSADMNQINHHYDRIEHYLDKTDTLGKLKPIVDLERFHRKLLLGRLHPMEFVKLVQSYEIIQTIAKEDNQEIYDLLVERIKKYGELFCFENMSQCKFDQMHKNFFQEGVYPEIDSLVKEKQNNFSKLESLRISMIEKLISNDKKLTDYSDDLVKLIKTDKEGYHVTMTKLRWEKISKYFQFESRVMSSYVKLTNKTIKDINDNLDEIAKEMSEKLTTCYLDFCEKVDSKELHRIHDYVAILDVYLSSAKVANMYGYRRPTLVKDDKSWIVAKDMRHPLIERVHTTENYVPNDITLGKDETGMIITGINACGKCFGGDTNLLMIDGSTKNVKDIQVGDLLMGDDSTPRRVLSLTSGKDELYEVINKRGDRYVVNKEHILCLKSSLLPIIKDRTDRQAWYLLWFNPKTYKRTGKYMSYKDKNKEEVLREIQKFKQKIEQEVSLYFTISVKNYLNLTPSCQQILSGYKVGVEFPIKDLPFDPYILGLWLGDGSKSSSEYTTQESSTIKYLKENLGQYNCYLQYCNYKTTNYAYRICSTEPLKQHKRSNFMMKILSDYNLLNNKHIPDDYKINSRKNRLKLLAGLIDSDGYLNDYGTVFEITQKNKKLAEDIEFLARSLGFMCYIKKCKKSCTYKNKKRTGTYYRLNICGDYICDIPTLCPRKQAKYGIKTLNRDNLASVITVNSIGTGQYYGFETDGNHKFLLDNFIVTHNSSFMRAVGVNVSLAQSGFFVACSSMELSLFKTILTRIEGNDDMLHNKSSFMVEMVELKSILERSNEFSLVLADELTNGTETNSGVALMSATMMHLSERSVPYIFTTHLHKIQDIEEINNLKNVGFYHLKMEISDDKIVINRKLEQGFCPPHYGIEVAKFVLKNDTFIRRAFKIRNDLLGEHNELVSTKKSRYNANVYMDKCQWDGCTETKQLHTHHIKHQEHADDNGLNDGYIRKNQESNLMVLCEKHHKLIHT